MEIVVKGRRCEISDRFRSHVEEKLTRLEKYNQRIIRVDVEVSQEANPRLSSQSVRVEITIASKGPVIRAEATAEDKLSALDRAMERLVSQARKASDRRRVHHGARTPTSLAQAMATHDVVDNRPAPDDVVDLAHKVGPLTVFGDGPIVVREKSHPAAPMTLDQALDEMELVGTTSTCSSTRRTSSRRSSTDARDTTTA